MVIASIGVVGAGAMGTGIAYAAAAAGFRVRVYDNQSQATQRSLKMVERLSASAVEKGRLTDSQRMALLERLSIHEKLEELRESDLVIEAVAEILDVKLALFTQLDELLSPQAIIASNTSSMSITALASATKRPGQVAGMHFFNPVHAMKLVEIIRSLETADDTMQVLREVTQALGKTAIVVNRDTPGFVVNRLLLPQMREAIKIMEEGVASMEDIDTAVRLGLNHPMGIFALQDLTGIDICFNILEYFRDELGDSYTPPQLMKQMVRAGKFGRKTGQGWYDYCEQNEEKGKDKK